METFLKIVRWILSFLLAIIFGLVLMLSILISAVSLTITDRENPKLWLVESGIYQHAKPLIRNTILNQSDPGSEMEEFALKLDNPNDSFGNLINDKLDPQFLQSSAEIIIDAFYDWFEGETELPEFTINLADTKEDVVKIAVIAFEEKVSSLPTCEPGVEASDEFKPLSADCLPEGYDVSAVSEYIESNTETPEFLKFIENFNINSKMLKFPPGTTAQVQLTYSFIENAPYILLLVVTVLAFLLAGLIPGAKRGFRMVSTSIILYSTILLITAFLAIEYMPNIMESAYQYVDIPAEDLTFKAIEGVLLAMYNAFFGNLKIVAVVGIVYGAIFAICGHFLGKLIEGMGKEK